MQESVLVDYIQKRTSLSWSEIEKILARGREHTPDLARTLLQGGVILFPHCCITLCGDQVAAAAYAALEACRISGKNQILALGVMHSLSDRLWEGRMRERRGEDLSEEPCRGIFGPGLPKYELLKNEFSLDNFTFLIEKIAKLHGWEMPNILMRYPNLVDGKPEILEGIEEVKQLAKTSILVATADLWHQGEAYCRTLLPCEEREAVARKSILENLHLLSTQDYLAYRNHCFKIFSDTKDVGQLLQYLLGPLVGTLYDFRLVDVSYLFSGALGSSSVATTIVSLLPCAECP